MAASAQAATATGDFNVNITLTPACQINNTSGSTGAVISDLNLVYTSYQLTDATGTTSFQVRCTNTLPYALGLSNTSATDSAVDLAYTLNLSASSTYAAGTNGTLSSLTGTGTNQSYYIHGTIASGQAGTCATTAGCNNSTATNRARTLTVTY